MHWNRHLIAPVLLLFVGFGSARAADSTSSFVHKKKYVMGSVFDIVAYNPSPAQASAAIDKAFQEIVRLDGVMNNYRADSQLSRLNKSATFHPASVSPDLYHVIRESLDYSRLSGGKFDISVGPLVSLWKAALGGNRLPSKEEVAAARRCTGSDKVVLIPPNRVMFRSTCIQLDLGAIGKGYAVDRAVDVLREFGIKSALINAGGSTIYGMGSPPGEAGWLVHLRDPSRQIDPTVVLFDESISTSEQSRASYLEDNSPGHIIDPETGRPLKTRFAVSVVARTATSSDALSTTLLLVGPDDGVRIIDNVPGTAALWIAPDGESHSVSNGPRILSSKQAESPYVSHQPLRGCGAHE